MLAASAATRGSATHDVVTRSRRSSLLRWWERGESVAYFRRKDSVDACSISRRAVSQLVTGNQQQRQRAAGLVVDRKPGLGVAPREDEDDIGSAREPPRGAEIGSGLTPTTYVMEGRMGPLHLSSRCLAEPFRATRNAGDGGRSDTTSWVIEEHCQRRTCQADKDCARRARHEDRWGHAVGAPTTPRPSLHLPPTPRIGRRS